MADHAAGHAPEDPRESHGSAGALLIIQALLYGLAHVILFGLPRWGEWSDQSFWVALALGCFGVPVVGRREWGTAGLLGMVSIAALVVWPCLDSEWSRAGARVPAFLAILGGTWVFLRSGLQLSARRGVSVFLACMLAGGIAVAIDVVYLKAARLFAVLLALLVLTRIVTGAFRFRSLEPVLFLFFGTTGLALVLAGWLHTVTDQRPFAGAYVAVALLPMSAWWAEIPGVAARPPLVRVGAQIVLTGSLLALACYPLVRTWLTGGFNFAGS